MVGNGGGLLLKENGALIDGHTAVFRFNGGIVRGFEQYVGERTTFRLANFDHFAFHEDGAPPVEGAVLQHVTRPEALQKLSGWCANGDERRHNLTVAALDPEFHYHVLNTVARGGPSNGFYGTILAVELCKHVTLFGFQKDWKASAGRVKYHYYDAVEPTDTQGARDTSEKARFAQYVREVNEYAAKCAADGCSDPRVDKSPGAAAKIVYAPSQ